MIPKLPLFSNPTYSSCSKREEISRPVASCYSNTRQYSELYKIDLFIYKTCKKKTDGKTWFAWFYTSVSRDSMNYSKRPVKSIRSHNLLCIFRTATKPWYPRDQILAKRRSGQACETISMLVSIFGTPLDSIMFKWKKHVTFLNLPCAILFLQSGKK